MGLYQALTRRKPVEKGIEQTSLEKTLHWYDLTAYGIAATVGSGIFVICGVVARKYAGPAVVFSTLTAGLLSLFTGICYLEFASSLPISGSGYAYFYTMLGEFLGWFIGWNLTLEYSFAAAAIAGGWTDWFVTLMRQFGWTVPKVAYEIIITEGGIFRVNLLAGTISLLIGLVVSRGIKFGAKLTNVITVLNVGIMFFIIAIGSFSVKRENWANFFPFGIKGVFRGAGEMFFSYIGYDTISSLAGEAINPGRDLPIAVFLTVVTATILYMGAGLVLTGIQNYTLLDEKSPLFKAFLYIRMPWAACIIGICAILTMAATIFACTAGQPKIFQAIAKDGLLPRAFARENSMGTPVFSVAFTTILTAVLATFLDVNSGLIEMITFGTLLAMSMLCAGLLVVRFRQCSRSAKVGTATTVVFFFGSLATAYCLIFRSTPVSMILGLAFVGLPFIILCLLFLFNGHTLSSTSKAFACPLMPILPCVAICANTYMMFYQMADGFTSLLQFAIWTILGLLIYSIYGIRHSHLRIEAEKLTP